MGESHVKDHKAAPGRPRQTTLIISCRMNTGKFSLMEVRGLEPLTYGLQSHRSSQLSYTPEFSVGLLPHAV
jgi:hypothetical protein